MTLAAQSQSFFNRLEFPRNARAKVSLESYESCSYYLKFIAIAPILPIHTLRTANAALAGSSLVG